MKQSGVKSFDMEAATHFGVESRDRPREAGAHDANEVALVEVLHSASEAVTALADGLHALNLRVALIKGTTGLRTASDAGASSLDKIHILVDSVSNQMCRIQALLPWLQISAHQIASLRGKRDELV